MLESFERVWADIRRLPGAKKDVALSVVGSSVKPEKAFDQFSNSRRRRRAYLESEAGSERLRLSNSLRAKAVEAFRHPVR